MAQLVLAEALPDGAPAPGIDRRAFEEMVDSSLRIADRVDLDDQKVEGDFWLMRACKWVYMPYRFRLAYHINHGELAIVYFQAQPWGGRWQSVRSTDEYRDILKGADAARKATP